MTQNLKYTGLCETCDHDATCTLRRSTQLAIIQCEEFSVSPPLASQNISDRDPMALPDLMEAGRLGLCANCLDVITCRFPNARRGVLQCEEYILDEAGVIPPLAAERSRSAA
jgi:hypothetical protein